MAALSHLWHKSVYTSTLKKSSFHWLSGILPNVTAKGKTGELIAFHFMKTEFSLSQQKVEGNTFGQEDPSDLYADGV